MTTQLCVQYKFETKLKSSTSAMQVQNFTFKLNQRHFFKTQGKTGKYSVTH